MIQATERVELTIAQTEDVTAVGAVWGHYGNGDDLTDLPRAIKADGSAKRCSGDTRNPGLGRDLATLRALRGLCQQIEDSLPPGTLEEPQLPEPLSETPTNPWAQLVEWLTGAKARPFTPPWGSGLIGPFTPPLIAPTPDMVPSPSFAYDHESNTLTLSKTAKRDLLGWLTAWQLARGAPTVLAEMIEAVRGVPTTDGAK